MTASPTGLLAQPLSASRRERMQDDGHDQHLFTAISSSQTVIEGARQRGRRERHWSIFTHLLRDAGVRANGAPDAYVAALAIENGATWASRDRGFARFAGLKLLDPARA